MHIVSDLCVSCIVIYGILVCCRRFDIMCGDFWLLLIKYCIVLRLDFLYLQCFPCC
jgi:hypothetical protein